MCKAIAVDRRIGVVDFDIDIEDLARVYVIPFVDSGIDVVNGVDFDDVTGSLRELTITSLSSLLAVVVVDDVDLKWPPFVDFVFAVSFDFEVLVI